MKKACIRARNAVIDARRRATARLYIEVPIDRALRKVAGGERETIERVSRRVLSVRDSKHTQKTMMQRRLGNGSPLFLGRPNFDPVRLILCCRRESRRFAGRGGEWFQKVLQDRAQTAQCAHRRVLNNDQCARSDRRLSAAKPR